MATASRSIIVVAVVQAVITGGGGGGGGGGSTYVPIVNSQAGTTGTLAPTLIPGFTTTNTGTLNSVSVLTQSGTTLSLPPVMSSRLKRKILRALLTNRALERNRSESSELSTISIDMASAPVLNMRLLEVADIRVNIRLAPASDAKIIGELKK